MLGRHRRPDSVTRYPWPVLAALHRQIEGGAARLSPQIYDALADRLEVALAAATSEDLRIASDNLQEAVYAIALRSSPAVRDALRGSPAADPDLLSAFWAGQTAFAQLLSARALDKRGDDRFVARLTDPRYERYLQALVAAPQTGAQLVSKTGERKETVSRKLGALAHLGIIERRRQGSHVVNVLVPAAQDFLRHHQSARWSRPAPRAASAFRSVANDLGEHLQGPVVIGEASHKAKVAAS